MKYKDWENGKIYATKEEAKKDYLNTIINDSYYLADIVSDYGPGYGNIISWIEEKGLLKEFYLTFKDIFDEGIEEVVECWVDDLEEVEED